MLARVVSIVSLSGLIFLYFRLCGCKPIIIALSAAVVVALILGINFLIECRLCALKGKETPVKKTKQGYDWSMHYFRAFAILAIVLLHFLVGIDHGRFGRALFRGATVYFLFISGYLCQFIYDRKKTAAIDYYKKKVLNVILPYFIWTTITISLVVLFAQDRFNIISPSGINFETIVGAFALGSAQSQYWYIPFVTLLFAVSPVLCRIKCDWLNNIFVVALIAAVVFPERAYLTSFRIHDIVQLYIYFTWSYIFGFVYCRNKERLNIVFAKLFWPLLILAVITTVGLYSSATLHLKVCNIWLLSNLQKLVVIPMAIVLLLKIKDRRISILESIADYSFTLYFIHMFFIQDFINLHNHYHLNWGGMLF